MNELPEEMILSAGVSVVLPALNEENNIKVLSSEIIDYFNARQIKYEIIIVDDGSTDRTGEVADRLSTDFENVSVIHHQGNKGYGRSLRDGFQAGRHEYLFYTDADRQFRINSLDKFLPFIKDGKVEMVIGYRIDRQDNFLRRFLSWCFNKVICIFFSLDCKDIDCAFKLFKSDAYRGLELKSDDFLIDTEILVKAQLKKLKIEQIGVEHYPRTDGESTVSFSQILVTIKRLFSFYVEVKNMKIN